MTLRDYTANVISASKVVPDGNFKDSKASGVWDINEALDLIKGGNWPNAANINPSAFVDGLFQCHLYAGTSGSLSINNGIDLSKGGLVWFKDRNYANNHRLYDTARGVRKYLDSSSTAVEATNSGSGNSNGISAFNSNGFTIGNDGYINDSSSEYVSWTFRKQPKFFDIVTYTGNGTAGRTISHNLGSVPGFIIVKRLNGSDNWTCYHRGVDSTAPEDYILYLNDTAARSDQDLWADTAPTSSVFSVGDNVKVNGSSSNTYVAYLFAHNNDDGGFGEPGDQDIIKCGSYTGNSSNTGPIINLGFEPQWIMIKRASNTGNWFIIDTMRGFTNGGSDPFLVANATNSEASNTYAQPLSTGFQITKSSSAINYSGDTYIYMAIRRGGMQTPTAASDVFAIDTQGSTGDGNAPTFRSNFPVDMAIRLDTGGANKEIAARLQQGKWLYTNLTSAEASADKSVFDYNNGWYSATSTISTYYGLMWARARGYFDVVTYSGTGSAQTLNHNLGVAPEMIWSKSRNNTTSSWAVTGSALGASGSYMFLTGTGGVQGTGSNTDYDNNQDATATQFQRGAEDSQNSTNYIAYLFATVANVSKVGSFTQSGATNVDCGFTGDTPSFILLKRTDSGGDWITFDSARGIVAGNDKSLDLNNTDAEVTNADVVDPYSGGFATTSSLTNGDYLFYAIAATS